MAELGSSGYSATVLASAAVRPEEGGGSWQALASGRGSAASSPVAKGLWRTQGVGHAQPGKGF